MNELRIQRLSIEHFKGQAHTVLEFCGKNCTIYGDNATGKTTIYDALTWLLFGKDSLGQGSFEIKPLGTDGKVMDHAAITSVEAVLDTADGAISLKKTYYEKWSTKRGSADESFDGNTSDYYVDGVPSKKYEFERRVAEVVSEDVFRLLTGVTWFCAGMDWKERRRVLFDVCGIASDRSIMAGEPRFAPLAEAMGRLPLDDYKKKIQAERRGLSGVREDVPVRLDECQKTVEELADIDFLALRVQRDRRAAKRELLSAELLKLEHNALLDAKHNELGALQNQIAKLENDNAVFRQGQVVPQGDGGGSIRAEREMLERNLLRLEEEKRLAEQAVSECSAEVEHCRTLWQAVSERQFTDVSCHACGQSLPAGLLDGARAKFEVEKTAELKDAVADADRLKARGESHGQRLKTIAGEATAVQARIAELGDLIAAVKPVVQLEISDSPGYAEQAAALRDALAEVEAALLSLSGENASIKEETRQKIASLAEEISAIEGTLSKETLLAFTQERMEKLRAEAQAAAEQICKLDAAIYLCEEFTRYKVQFVENNINSKFRLAQFRLFVEQVNGGLADCCEVMHDGVPYGSLNNGMRINVGMDVIATLSEHYGVRVPLFVDNAESVTALCGIPAQVIRLVVSEADQKLRCEHEG